MASKLNELYRGDLTTIAAALDLETPSNDELRLAVINLCGIVARLEKRIAQLTDNGHPNGDPMNDPPSLR